MLVLQIVRWLLLAAEVWIALPILYLCILSISAILIPKKRKTKDTTTSSSTSSTAHFAILIPAHTALYLLNPSREVYIALCYAPGFIVWKLWVYFVLRRNKKSASEWVRTSRT